MKFKKGDVVKSPVNYRMDIGTKIGIHSAVVVSENDKDTMKVRLITHDGRGNNTPIEREKLKGMEVDENTYITNDPIKGVIKFFRKISGAKYE